MCLGWVIFAVKGSMCQVLRVVISMEKQEHLEFWLYIRCRFQNEISSFDRFLIAATCDSPL